MGLKANVRALKRLSKFSKEMGSKAGWKMSEPLAIKTYKMVAKVYKKDPEIQEYVNEIIDAIKKKDSKKHKIYVNLLRAKVMTKSF